MKLCPQLKSLLGRSLDCSLKRKKSLYTWTEQDHSRCSAKLCTNGEVSGSTMYPVAVRILTVHKEVIWALIYFPRSFQELSRAVLNTVGIIVITIKYISYSFQCHHPHRGIGDNITSCWCSCFYMGKRLTFQTLFRGERQSRSWGEAVWPLDVNCDTGRVSYLGTPNVGRTLSPLEHDIGSVIWG